MRTTIVIIMVSSFFALGINDFADQNWRTAIASILLGFVQMIFFWEGMK